MDKIIVKSDNAPAAVGPYSQAIKIGDLVYTSGQIGLVPATGELVGDDVQAQAEQALNNLAQVLEAAGTSLAHVVKTTVFLRYMKDYTAVNEVYASFFGETPPARSAVAVAALPLAAKVEIEAVAIMPSDSTPEATTEVEIELEEEEEASEHDGESVVDASAVFITNAVEAVETAVASGLRQLANILAEIQDEIEKQDTAVDEAAAASEPPEKPKKKKKKKGKKKKE